MVHQLRYISHYVRRCYLPTRKLRKRWYLET